MSRQHALLHTACAHLTPLPPLPPPLFTPAQPGGFQYVLRYSTHGADVTALALATKLKLAAVADASGRLSLVDLLQPAQLFSARAMPQAVAQAAFGSHVVPGATKEDPSVERCARAAAAAGSPACRRCAARGARVRMPCCQCRGVLCCRLLKPQGAFSRPLPSQAPGAPSL